MILRESSERIQALLSFVDETRAQAVFFNNLYDPVSLVSAFGPFPLGNVADYDETRRRSVIMQSSRPWLQGMCNAKASTRTCCMSRGRHSMSMGFHAQRLRISGAGIHSGTVYNPCQFGVTTFLSILSGSLQRPTRLRSPSTFQPTCPPWTPTCAPSTSSPSRGFRTMHRHQRVTN